MPRSATALLDFQPVAQALPDVTAREPSDNSQRDIYGLLGIPIDVTTMKKVVDRIETAAASAKPLLISTANVNFLTTSSKRSGIQGLAHLQRSLHSGWNADRLARPLAGNSDEKTGWRDPTFSNAQDKYGPPTLKVFLFGGAKGVAATAAEKINAQKCGMVCTGSYFPGYGDVEEMSSDAIIDTINASGADMPCRRLGRPKGSSLAPSETTTA